MANVDIFVGNNISIDTEIYQLYINGFSENDAAKLQQRRGTLQQYNATFDMLLSDIRDHYRTYTTLQPFLKNPQRMPNQIEFQIEPDMQRHLIEKYYEFDEVVMRELLGKKLSSRFRGNLDDVAEKTRVTLNSCRRQFDNVKRVLRAVEELDGHLVDNISAHFLLPTHLAQQYAAAVFMANSRFETSKKKLTYLTFQDFVYCVNHMIAHWSYSSEECVSHADMDVDLDRDFLLGLRDVKALSEKDCVDEHKHLLEHRLQGSLGSQASDDVSSSFKNYAKVLVNIAYGLNHSKELRDFFLDLIEKLLEPWRSSGWSVDDVTFFMRGYAETCPRITVFRNNPSLLRTWERYLKTVTPCVIRMYHT